MLVRSRQAIAAALSLAVSASCAAAETPDRGRHLLQQNCGSCHAIGSSGRSAHPAAPPFRRIGRRLDVDALTDRMGDLLVSTHRDMPSFRFSRRDARAIRIYLNSIQE